MPERIQCVGDGGEMTKTNLQAQIYNKIPAGLRRTLTLLGGTPLSPPTDVEGDRN